MIRVDHLCKSFDGQIVLDDISLSVGEDEIVVVLGASGTGKSVLLKSMMGLMKPDSGEIWIGGKEITRLPEKDLLKVRRDIGFLFQEGALYDFMNVFENIAFPLQEHTSFDNATIAEKVRNVLSVVDLEGVEQKYPSELSGGMKKRVGLARAVILGSKALFCDEPTSGLDPIRSRDISDLIKDISKRLRCSTVITSHDIKNAFRIADRCVLMHDGRILAAGTKAELKASTDDFVQAFVE